MSTVLRFQVHKNESKEQEVALVKAVSKCAKKELCRVSSIELSPDVDLDMIHAQVVFNSVGVIDVTGLPYEMICQLLTHDFAGRRVPLICAGSGPSSGKVPGQFLGYRLILSVEFESIPL
ncbi:MAG: hypothetical protein IT292_02495 [Deltaproteobacteria bacterium]|nr:hypothetical protein [Deltaproteobacteria bacterium]